MGDFDEVCNNWFCKLEQVMMQNKKFSQKPLFCTYLLAFCRFSCICQYIYASKFFGCPDTQTLSKWTRQQHWRDQFTPENRWEPVGIGMKTYREACCLNFCLFRGLEITQTVQRAKFVKPPSSKALVKIVLKISKMTTNGSNSQHSPYWY